MQVSSSPIETISLLNGGVHVELKSSEANKCYFVHQDFRSYPLQTLFNDALAYYLEKVSKIEFLDKNQHITIELFSPQKQKYGLLWSYSRVALDVLVQSIVKEIKSSTFVDWAATNNDLECPLSLDNFKKPVICNLNGTTYSRDWIEEAIKRTLIKDKNLYLGNIEIHPSMISDIKLYKNLTWHQGRRGVINYSLNQIRYKKFNIDEARRGNLPKFVELLGNLPTKQGCWDAEKLYNVYADYRGLPHFTDLNQTIENLVVKGISFPPLHLKCDMGHITFSNIFFERCKMRIECWCGLSIKSSRFKRCTLDLRGIARPIEFRRCRLIKCRILIKSKKDIPGTFRNAAEIPNILSLVENIVDDPKRLVNCTLIVE